MRLMAILTGVLTLLGCARSTRSLAPVSGFDGEKYMGVWYEIGRFPHFFERGLTSVTAEYTLLDDGTIRVVNRGYNSERGKWKTATARARFKGDRKSGWLKVTFFPPFSADYKILALDDPGYTHAVVTSGTFDYLWILSRSPEMDEAVYSGLVRFAESSGFDVSRLERVDQERIFPR